MKYAFRCRNCGRLDTSDHAGQAPHPLSCRVCGHGSEAENWDQLWKLSEPDLSKFGLTKGNVNSHVPGASPASNKQVKVSAEDGVKSKNKTR